MTTPATAPIRKPAAFTRLRLAFYTRRIGIFGWLTGLFAGSPYHVELVFNDDLLYSAATNAHGGVGTRFQRNPLPPPNWTIVELDPKYAAAAWDFCVAEQGCPYDYYGIVVGWTYNCRPSPTRWFCSEVCAAALMHAGMLLRSQQPQYYTPRRLLLELTTPAPETLAV